jgi:hypothetical protein
LTNQPTLAKRLRPKLHGLGEESTFGITFPQFSPLIRIIHNNLARFVQRFTSSCSHALVRKRRVLLAFLWSSYALARSQPKRSLLGRNQGFLCVAAQAIGNWQTLNSPNW